MTCASACGLLSRKPESSQRVKVVCAPKALDLCTVSRWMLPAEISADQAGELALSANAEALACQERQAAAVDCIRKHEDAAKE